MEKPQTKYLFVTGGVVSGLGKGITAASLGRLLKARGYKVALQKFDPYINVDPGKMSPYQHGEVFVTDDGAETDLDIGHYERFVDENLSINSSVTTGKIYQSVIKKERDGVFGGATVQVIPHITNEIKERIFRVSKRQELDFVITEIGGTVGDIECHPFLEAIRQIPYDIGRNNVLYVHVTLVPFLASSGEQKTKPTQHSVKELQNIGIQPDIIVCRAQEPISKESREKLALFCNVDKNCVVQNLDSPNLYEIPLLLESEGLGNIVMEKLGLTCDSVDLEEWTNLVERVNKSHKSGEVVKVALVGNYVELKDAYLSYIEALKAGGFANDVVVELDWISCESVNEKSAPKLFKGCKGIIVPSGGEKRGIEGAICAIKYAREHDIPFLGMCFGMQAMLIEVARNLLDKADANSMEFDPLTMNPILVCTGNNGSEEDKYRRGLFPIKIERNTLVHSIYGGADLVYERHRNQFEFNNVYKNEMRAAGVIFAGASPDDNYVEIVQIEGKRWFVGAMFNAQFKSRPNRAHPLFREFIRACKA